MAGTRTWRRRGEQGATTVEHVALAVVVALIGTWLATGAGRVGAPVGSDAAARLEAAVTSPQAPRRWRDATERRWGGGDVRVRVSRDDLRLTPFVDRRATWARSWILGRRIERADVRITGDACALCLDGTWSRSVQPMVASTGSDGGHVGLAAGADLDLRAALVSAEGRLHAERPLPGGGEVTADGRVRGTLGAEADASARLRVGRDGVVELDVEGGAMAGAVAKAEGRVGVELLGIAISQSGSAEGWAGAGVRGTAGVTRGDGRVSWRVGWGGALGLGGAAEWGGEIDVSRVPRRHRRMGRDALVWGLRGASVLGLPTNSLVLGR